MKYNKSYFNSSTTKDKSIYFHYKHYLIQAGIKLDRKYICDLGCATGEFLETIENNKNIYGVDVSRYAINKCIKKFPNIKTHFSAIDIDRNIFTFNIKFEIITMFDVIEHLSNFYNLKSIIATYLKRGGYLLVTTPNANSILRIVSKKNFTGEIDETHTQLFTPYTLDFLLRKMGMKKVALFTPFNFYFKNNTITRRLLIGGQIVAIYKKNV